MSERKLAKLVYLSGIKATGYLVHCGDIATFSVERAKDGFAIVRLLRMGVREGRLDVRLTEE